MCSQASQKVSLKVHKSSSSAFLALHNYQTSKRKINTEVNLIKIQIMEHFLANLLISKIF